MLIPYKDKGEYYNIALRICIYIVNTISDMESVIEFGGGFTFWLQGEISHEQQ